MYFVNLSGSIEQRESCSYVKNSAFLSGTGLIETMLLRNHNLPLLNDHYERLISSLKKLYLFTPFDLIEMKNQINKLLKVNNHPSNGIIRLQTFNNTNQSQADYLIEYKPMPAYNPEGIKTGLAKGIAMPQDSLSNLKTSSRLRYIIARNQAMLKNWDDALLLNHSGRISESTISNIFWIKNNTIFTPPLSEGCVAGIMRSRILCINIPNYIMQECVLTLEILAEAEEVFLTNAVRGIIPVRYIQAVAYNMQQTKNITRFLEPLIFSEGTKL